MSVTVTVERRRRTRLFAQLVTGSAFLRTELGNHVFIKSNASVNAVCLNTGEAVLFQAGDEVVPVDVDIKARTP